MPPTRATRLIARERLAAPPAAEGVDGVLIPEVESEDEARRIMDEDPFVGRA